MKYCERCTKVLTNKQTRYCSNKCQRSAASELVVEMWLGGADVGYTGKAVQIKKAIRRYLLEQAKNACSLCGWDRLHPVDGRPLVEVDHIDGDALNCSPENLRVLCPNCHSMTPTFRARNTQSTRVRKTVALPD